MKGQSLLLFCIVLLCSSFVYLLVSFFFVFCCRTSLCNNRFPFLIELRFWPLDPAFSQFENGSYALVFLPITTEPYGGQVLLETVSIGLARSKAVAY